MCTAVDPRWMSDVSESANHESNDDRSLVEINRHGVPVHVDASTEKQIILIETFSKFMGNFWFLQPNLVSFIQKKKDFGYDWWENSNVPQ